MIMKVLTQLLNTMKYRIEIIKHGVTHWYVKNIIIGAPQLVDKCYNSTDTLFKLEEAQKVLLKTHEKKNITTQRI